MVSIVSVFDILNKDLQKKSYLKFTFLNLSLTFHKVALGDSIALLFSCKGIGNVLL